MLCTSKYEINTPPIAPATPKSKASRRVPSLRFIAAPTLWLVTWEFGIPDPKRLEMLPDMRHQIYLQRPHGACSFGVGKNLTRLEGEGKLNELSKWAWYAHEFRRGPTLTHAPLEAI